MTEHPTITALRATAPHKLSPLPWRVDDDGVSLDAVLCSTGLEVSIGSYDKDASHIAAAVNAAPHLLAEVDALRAQVAAAREAVAQWTGTVRHFAFCDSLTIRPYHPRHKCNCGAVKQNEQRLAARRALGLEE